MINEKTLILNKQEQFQSFKLSNKLDEECNIGILGQHAHQHCFQITLVFAVRGLCSSFCFLFLLLHSKAYGVDESLK
jgi:hypothetical protein